MKTDDELFEEWFATDGERDLYYSQQDAFLAALAIGRKQGREERDRELDNQSSL